MRGAVAWCGCVGMGGIHRSARTGLRRTQYCAESNVPRRESSPSSHSFPWMRCGEQNGAKDGATIGHDSGDPWSEKAATHGHTTSTSGCLLLWQWACWSYLELHSPWVGVTLEDYRHRPAMATSTIVC